MIDDSRQLLKRLVEMMESDSEEYAIEITGVNIAYLTGVEMPPVADTLEPRLVQGSSSFRYEFTIQVWPKLEPKL